MSSINTNAGVFAALRNLNVTSARLDTNANNISTGKKVSGPKDDASIFSIAQSLSSDLKSFDSVQQTLFSAAGVTAVAIAGASQVSDLLGNLKAQAIEAVPIKRFLEADEVAELVCYIASDAAGGITGQAINICGGQTMA